MVENYTLDRYGIIKQIKKESVVYDHRYVHERYCHPKVPTENISYLRLGYLLSQLGKIPKSLLDVGYGNGAFLTIAKKIIFNCYGYDILPAYPLDKEIVQLDNLYEKKVEVVTFFDSLEHFDNIYDIHRLRCNHILISVPFCHYLDDDWFLHWKHRKPNEHLWHFNLDSLQNFMKAMGFNYRAHSYLEDVIRKPTDERYPNILTSFFSR